ncbi:MAG: molybdenum cofactor biosynthesis protein MoaE [Planctomycetota bacterium]|nr:MAG: molybdenum cofactor biosynthesis protein MoaE [Planctomycetota bacterium]
MDDGPSERCWVHIGPEPIDAAGLLARVADRDAGAQVLFTGTVRARTGGRAVRHLEYEAYVPMAQAQCREIAEASCARHGACRMAIAHRTGRLAIGEIAVAIAVSAPHRAEAYAASREAIEALKHEVAIWKREVFTDGSRWVYGCGS